MDNELLKAPFPYYGGKSRLASVIWDRIGSDVDVYVEPFAGSIACLLARPGGAGKREVVCDLDGGICNFWRAVQNDPEGVAYWADYPSIHQDLTARHRWLREWISDNSHRLSEDPEYHDVKAAGWWVWGISLWIGGGWCHDSDDRRPGISDGHGGRGVTMQRIKLAVDDKRPRVSDRDGGRGVSVQRTARPKLLSWFSEIQRRLEAVVVLNRSWESALTPTILQQTPSSPGGSVGVLMDPPYVTDDRNDMLYSNEHQSSSVARDSFAWSVENGDKYRIAYCCHDGDFEVPDGWVKETAAFGGVYLSDLRVKLGRSVKLDCVLFSPACMSESQIGLFKGS